MSVQGFEVAAQLRDEVADGPTIGTDVATSEENTDVLVFMGRPFKIADKFGLMPLIKFGYLSKKGLDTGDEDALAAMYDVIRQAIAPKDWDAFCDHAADTRADADDLMGAVAEAIQVISSRPTRRPSDSSDGPPAIETSSSDDSSSAESFESPREAQRREHLKLLAPVGVVAEAMELTGTG
jgi:hypothetical protein